MTSYAEEKSVCAICKETSVHQVLASTNSFGAPDLDGRPPPMVRNTMNSWVIQCPSCGYCSGNMSSKLQTDSEVVRSAEYQKQLLSEEFPFLANRFLCQSMLLEKARLYSKAGGACIHAAWVCDDTIGSLLDLIFHWRRSAGKMPSAAVFCRKKAITLLEKGHRKGQYCMFNKEDDELLMIDLLRRTRQFSAAKTLCEQALKKKREAFKKDILKLEKRLIETEDDKCHNISEMK